jgi:GNAT superfamily N-acetyltransferase
MCLQGEAALACAAPLFDHWEETLIWAVLEGRMGEMWVCTADAERIAAGQQPAAACCRNGDFLFFAGSAVSPEADVLMQGIREKTGERFRIAVPQNEGWSLLIARAFDEHCGLGERYAIRKEKDCFDTAHLTRLAETLPEGLRIVPIDRQMYQQVMSTGWAVDFCSQFPDADAFVREGLGYVCLLNDEIVGGASSYIRYSSGIEIQVETRPDCRRLGIAAACCARLILTCLEKGLYPSWDAANRASVALAEKLGYHEGGAYPVWYLNSNV